MYFSKEEIVKLAIERANIMRAIKDSEFDMMDGRLTEDEKREIKYFLEEELTRKELLLKACFQK